MECLRCESLWSREWRVCALTLALSACVSDDFPADMRGRTHVEAVARMPVEGWIGANLLRLYRVTFDYQGGVSYWRKLDDPDRHELDGVGISLIRKGDGIYRIGGVVRKDGRETVTGVKRGDVLTGIDGMRVTAESEREAVLSALHGHPGEPRRLTLERNGTVVEIDSIVTAF